MSAVYGVCAKDFVISFEVALRQAECYLNTSLIEIMAAQTV